MDSDRRSAQIERLEVVDTGRRRRWSEDEKLKIVLESLQAPRQAGWLAALERGDRNLVSCGELATAHCGTIALFCADWTKGVPRWANRALNVD